MVFLSFSEKPPFMLPTIDLSLIGILLIIWNVIKVIWSFVWGAIVWVKDQALTLMIGSRIWATITMLVFSLGLMALSSVVISFFLQWFSGLVLRQIDLGVFENSFKLISTVFPLRVLADLISTAISGWVYLYQVDMVGLWYSKLSIRCNRILASWKT